ncbi:hypothetical protein GCM10010295_39280 [Streptomyces intermedius]
MGVVAREGAPGREDGEPGQPHRRVHREGETGAAQPRRTRLGYPRCGERADLIRSGHRVIIRAETEPLGRGL